MDTGVDERKKGSEREAKQERNQIVKLLLFYDQIESPTIDFQTIENASAAAFPFSISPLCIDRSNRLLYQQFSFYVHILFHSLFQESRQWTWYIWYYIMYSIT